MKLTPEDFKLIAASASRMAVQDGIEPFKETAFEGRGVLMTALAYGKGCGGSASYEQPAGKVAPFAERNYYRELSKRLQTILKALIKEFPLEKSDCRVFCNSRLPEKNLATQAGLGMRGKNSLLILPGRGSLYVLGGILLPAVESISGQMDEGTAHTYQLCGDCTLCIEACPSQAITSPGVLDANLCLQGLSSREILVPPEVRDVWGNLFYGCNICQDVCPHNKHAPLPAACRYGHLGPLVDLRGVLEADDTELRKALFQGTVLDQAWISPIALKRNALIAAAHLSAGELLPLVEACLNHPSEVLRETAAWARNRLRALSGT